MSLERSVELRQLRYAVAVADHLNFREASRALHVAQPPLSVQIKQLEEEIGVALFIRSKRHVEITRPRKVFLKTAREALAMLGSAFLRRRAAELCDSYKAGAMTVTQSESI
jgi:DNA-binding transcriptional LysR family regulator